MNSIRTDTASGDLLADRRADYAEMLMAENDPRAAAELMLGALEIAPAWSFGWFRLGEMHEAAGDGSAAARAWRAALALDPSDRAGAALKLALSGETPPPDAPPSAFVETLFDQYAKRFDHALVEGLGYRVPDLLFEAIRTYVSPAIGAAPSSGPSGHLLPDGQKNTAAKPALPLPSGRGRGEGVKLSAAASLQSEPKFARAVDLGCGTGLMGGRLRPIVDKLAGYDISAEMLREARGKNVYDLLEKADLQTLPFPPAFDGRQADLITAADVFMYLGRLDQAFAGVAEMLAPGGVFAFSVEKHDGSEDFVLRETRRYAHSESYVRRLLEVANLSALSVADKVIRRDRNENVEGLIVLASRKWI